jgi:signal transduction histidine kinase
MVLSFISSNKYMRLADFILANIEPILAEWEAFARSLAPGAKMTKLALRNDAGSILLAAARDMQVAQSLAQQANKSKGFGGAGGEQSARLDNASELHGVRRVGSGFDIMEVVSEYRALRASVLRLWRESRPDPDQHDLDDITRFNESIDQSLASAVSSYTKRVDQSRRMFLAILSHDLRNPLNTIRMAALLVSRTSDDPASAQALAMIETNTAAIARLVSDLIDFASTGLGSAIPLTRGPVDLGALCREVIDAYRSTHVGRELKFHAKEDVAGNWDAARLRQVVSNLVSNALQHGDSHGDVELRLDADDSSVALSVHNSGVPIPPDVLTTIFDPLVRHATPESAAGRVPGSIGLGLYIVREIVTGHGGTVDVASTADAGTTFTIRLPRA